MKHLGQKLLGFRPVPEETFGFGEVGILGKSDPPAELQAGQACLKHYAHTALLQVVVPRVGTPHSGSEEVCVY